MARKPVVLTLVGGVALAGVAFGATALATHRGDHLPSPPVQAAAGSADATTDAVPAPGPVRHLVAHERSMSVELGWRPPVGTTAPSVSYLVTTRGPGAVRAITTSATHARLRGLLPGRHYVFTVRAANAAGPGTATSTRSVLPLLRMQAGPAPVIDGANDGTAIVDAAVTVPQPRAKAWHVDGVRFSYAWLADGRPIRGATHREFTPGPELAGQRISVRLTGHRPGYSAESVVSRPVTVTASPLAGGPWGVYRGPWDGVYPAYAAATGPDKAQLAKVALQPRVEWFTSNRSTSQIGPDIRSYIDGVQGGDRRTLVQLALFRIFPDSDGSEAGRDHPLSAAEQASYKAWMEQAAEAIGDTRTAVVLEPDLALVAPPTRAGAERTADPAVRESLVRWAAQRLSQLPHTSVYLDCGDADWLPVSACADLLSASGVEYARGFALGATHYSDVAGNIDYGSELVDALARAGHPGKHVVIDTADNGRGFTWPYWHAHQARLGSDFDNAAPCASVADVSCDTLGIPPTATTWGHPGLRLSAAQDQQAARLVDGYLWFGRPWLVRQAWPFDLQRTLQVARSTPWQ